MDREKVLAFLNIDLKKDIDRFTMKLFSWFYVGFGVFVFGGGSLLQLIEFSLFDFCALFFCIISIVFLFITRFYQKQNYVLFGVVPCSL